MKYKAGVVVGDLELLEALHGTAQSKVFRCMCHRCGQECERRMNAIYQGADCCEDCAKKVVADAVAESNKARTVHGAAKDARTPTEAKLYRLWQGIKQRCNNPEHPKYADYGGRGIRIHDPWAQDFRAFAEGVGLPPTPQHSLDRYPNNDGNYEPGNVRWATKWEQANNRRDTLLAEKDGRVQNLAEWAAELQMPYHVLYKRYKAGQRGSELFRALYSAR